MGTAFNLRHSESIFGLDIGQTSLKVMQLEHKPGKAPKVIGYGVSKFYTSRAIKDGEIVDQAVIAGALNELLQNRLIGSITTAKAACTLPSSHTFSRPIKLPQMPKDHILEAVELEAEQYIPLPPDKLYIDYEITNSDEKNLELLIVAAPRTIVDSYMRFLNAVGLQPVALEPSMNAIIRLFRLADPSREAPSILVDFGSLSIDLAVFDKTVFVNSTIEGGSDTITTQVAKRLGVSDQEAYVMKNKEGLAHDSDEQDLAPAIKPILDNLVREIRRIMRYYNDRTGNNRKISQVITTGGGATLKGLSEYLANELKMPVRMLDPWNKIDFGGLSPPSDLAKSMYLTVTGEAILSTQELRQ